MRADPFDCADRYSHRGLIGALRIGAVLLLTVHCVVISPAQTPAPAVTVRPSPSKVQPRGAVTALAFSPDGRQLALGTYGQVVLYDTASWQATGICNDVVDSVRALAYTPGGKSLAIGCGMPSRDGETLIWNLDPGAPPRRFAGQNDTVEAVTFRGDGKAMLCGANDNTARYYGAWPAATATKLDEHNGRVTAVAFSALPDFVFITGGMDKIVKVWDPKTVRTVVNFDQSEGGITGLAFLSNGTQFVGSSLDGKLYWWGVNLDKDKNTYTGYMFRSEMAHEGGVAALAASADCKRLITCGADNQVAVWTIDGGRLHAFKDCVGATYAVALNPDGRTAAAGGRDGLLYIWNVDGERLVTTLTPPALPRSLPARAQSQVGKTPTFHRSAGKQQ